MQQLQNATNAVTDGPDGCAGVILDTIPVLMRLIRDQMRRQRHPGLSVPQFRSLIFIHHTPDITLSDLAEHLGLSLPATSRLIAGLVKRGLVYRQQRADNRRCIRLSLTNRGQATSQATFEQARIAIADRLTTLSVHQLHLINRAMQSLNKAFEAQTEHNGNNQRSKNTARGVQTS